MCGQVWVLEGELSQGVWGYLPLCVWVRVWVMVMVTADTAEMGELIDLVFLKDSVTCFFVYDSRPHMREVWLLCLSC